MDASSVYRWLLTLYPRQLRLEHGEEMVAAFTDLRLDRGGVVWGRILLDLVVSVPRTRLESIMPTVASNRAVVLAMLGPGVLLSILTFFGFGLFGIVVPMALIGVASAQRSRLARSLDTPASPRGRRPALWTLGSSGAVLVGCLGSWAYHLRTYADFGDTTVIVHNALALVAVTGILASSTLLALRPLGGRTRIRSTTDG